MKTLRLALFVAVSVIMNAAYAASVKMQVPALQGTVQSQDLRLITVEPYIGCTLHDGAELVNGQRQESLNTQLAWQNPTTVQFQTAAATVKLTKWLTSGGACYAGVHLFAADAQNQMYERYLHVAATSRMDAKDLQAYVDSQAWQDEVRAAFQNINVILFYGGIELRK